MPNTSAQRKVIKSKEFVNNSDSEIEEYNILSRPKRNIILNDLSTIQTNNMIIDSDDDEDDEDFIIDANSYSDVNDSSSSSDVDDDDKNGDKSEKAGSDESMPASEEKKETTSIVNKLEKPKKKLKAKTGSVKKREPKTKPVQKKKTKKTTFKQKKIKKLIEMKKIESKNEIEKIFSSFKNVNKLKQPIKPEILIPREKLEQIINPDDISEWICSLCHNKPNSIDGLGPLFGPYSVSLSSIDLNREISDDAKLEVWLHEGCAIWNSYIYIKDNQVFGISNCLRAANKLECTTCKKRGAALTCTRNDCNYSFHYPCAVLSKCNLNIDNYSIQCKAHSIEKN